MYVNNQYAVEKPENIEADMVAQENKFKKQPWVYINYL